MTTEPTPADMDTGWRTARQLAEAFIPVRDEHDRTQCENLAIALAAFANAARSSEREAVLRRLTEPDEETVQALASEIYGERCNANGNASNWTTTSDAVRDGWRPTARAALLAVRDLLRKGQPT